jgi:hypothetical protein
VNACSADGTELTDGQEEAAENLLEQLQTYRYCRKSKPTDQSIEADSVICNRHMGSTIPLEHHMACTTCTSL